MQPSRFKEGILLGKKDQAILMFEKEQYFYLLIS